MITLIYPCLRHQAVGNGQQSAGANRLPAPMPIRHCQMPNPEKTLSCFAGLVVPAGGPYPIPFRTRPSNPPAPMVLRLKTRESRSLPGLQSTKLKTSLQNLLSTSPAPKRWTKPSHPAGWSSPVARQAHNLKVVSSNLAPATKFFYDIKSLCAALRGGVCV